MIVWTLCRDLRGRLALCLILQLLAASFHVSVFTTSRDWFQHPDNFRRAELVQRERAGDDFTFYLEFNTRGAPWGVFNLLVIVLAAGGIMSMHWEANLFLSLPVRRATWVLVQAAVILAAIVLLGLVENALFVLTTPMTIERAALRVLGGGLANTAAIAVTLAAMLWVRKPVRGGILAVIVLTAIEWASQDRFTSWNPGQLMLPSVWPTVWRPLLLVAIIATVGMLVAVFRFRRADY
jgi:hypothetical protein